MYFPVRVLHTASQLANKLQRLPAAVQTFALHPWLVHKALCPKQTVAIATLRITAFYGQDESPKVCTLVLEALQPRDTRGAGMLCMCERELVISLLITQKQGTHPHAHTHKADTHRHARKVLSLINLVAQV